MPARFNETDRLNERYVKFRPTELQRIAGEAVQQDYCPDIAKLADGGFNKVFLLRAKNGREVIARIPTPIAGPPHYTTASEVATLNFLRAVLKLPVPDVLAYSTSPDSPVGAEYILMERMKGESLSSRWLSLSTDEVKEIMGQIAEMERKILTSISLRMEVYITRRILTGRLRYHSWKISVSGLCLPGSFGMANEAEQILTAGPVGFPLSPSPSLLCEERADRG